MTPPASSACRTSRARRGRSPRRSHRRRWCCRRGPACRDNRERGRCSRPARRIGAEVILAHQHRLVAARLQILRECPVPSVIGLPAHRAGHVAVFAREDGRPARRARKTSTASKTFALTHHHQTPRQRTRPAFNANHYIEWAGPPARRIIEGCRAGRAAHSIGSQSGEIFPQSGVAVGAAAGIIPSPKRIPMPKRKRCVAAHAVLPYRV